jgi:glutaredoxin/glutathione-dependent peroxiredoxin
LQGELTMTIKVGDKLPEAKFRVMTAEGPQVKTTDDIFKGKKVALFAVPGAYTGTCHKMHLPSIFLNAYAIKDKGVNTIAIVSVNDAFVMNAWKRDTDQRDEATFLADGNAEFTKAIGMELDASGNGLGIRSHRYSMLVDDGVVKKLNLEPAPGKVEVSGGDTLLSPHFVRRHPLPQGERERGSTIPSTLPSRRLHAPVDRRAHFRRGRRGP